MHAVFAIHGAGGFGMFPVERAGGNLRLGRKFQFGGGAVAEQRRRHGAFGGEIILARGGAGDFREAADLGEGVEQFPAVEADHRLHNAVDAFIHAPGDPRVVLAVGTVKLICPAHFPDQKYYAAREDATLLCSDRHPCLPWRVASCHPEPAFAGWRCGSVLQKLFCDEGIPIKHVAFIFGAGCLTAGVNRFLFRCGSAS